MSGRPIREIAMNDRKPRGSRSPVAGPAADPGRYPFRQRLAAAHREVGRQLQEEDAAGPPANRRIRRVDGRKRHPLRGPGRAGSAPNWDRRKPEISWLIHQHRLGGPHPQSVDRLHQGFTRM
jgi:hypothetical protein